MNKRDKRRIAEAWKKMYAKFPPAPGLTAVEQLEYERALQAERSKSIPIINFLPRKR